MKYSQADPLLKGQLWESVLRNHNSSADGFNRTKDRICGYLFGLNAGGLVAGAAAIKELGSKCIFIAAIWIFVIGLLFELLAAGIDYLESDLALRSHSKKSDDVFKDKIEIEDYFGPRKPLSVDRALYSLRVLSGVLFVVGLFMGIAGAFH